jgi:hypothetical protein
MVAYTFEKIAKTNSVGSVGKKEVNEAQAWYKNTAKKLGTITQSTVPADKDRFTSGINRYSIGRMYMFHYSAKHKDTLPYWDRFPLVFPIELYPDGFLGINLHYISPIVRAKLMNALYETLNNQHNDDTTRLKISYEILRSASQFKYFKPCVKRYLYSHVRSRYMYISPAEWDVTIMLPTENFVGASSAKVYRESSRQF